MKKLVKMPLEIFSFGARSSSNLVYIGAKGNFRKKFRFGWPKMDVIDQRGDLLGGEGVEALTEASLTPRPPPPPPKFGP